MLVALSQPRKGACSDTCGAAKIGIVPQHPPAPLDMLLALPQAYAEFATPNIGHVLPALFRAYGVEVREAAQVQATIRNRGRRSEMVGELVIREDH